jgi:type VI protein secretion system component VasK
MGDKMFDTFAGSANERAPLSLVREEPDVVQCAPEMPVPSRQEVKAQATLFAVAALAAAAAFAVVGLTIVIIAVAVPQHWVAALIFTGLFVLMVVAAGLAVVWRTGSLPLRRWRIERAARLGVDAEAGVPAPRRRRRARGG